MSSRQIITGGTFTGTYRSMGGCHQKASFKQSVDAAINRPRYKPCQTCRHHIGLAPAFVTAEKMNIQARRIFGLLCKLIPVKVSCCRASSKTRRCTTRMMPIGVPRVPYRSQQAGGWQWVDIWNCLVSFLQALRVGLKSCCILLGCTNCPNFKACSFREAFYRGDITMVCMKISLTRG